MLTASLIFVATLALVIWQPRGLGIGWSAAAGGLAALLTGVIGLSDVPVVWNIVWNATATFIAVIIKNHSRSAKVRARFMNHLAQLDQILNWYTSIRELPIHFAI
jgi:Na+/H+ antiporter NhaD/arsenite permease-like protein